MRVEPVVLAVQTQGHAALLLLHLVLGREGDLGGGTPEIHSPHCSPARTQPASHIAILGGGTVKKGMNAKNIGETKEVKRVKNPFKKNLKPVIMKA